VIHFTSSEIKTIGAEVVDDNSTVVIRSNNLSMELFLAPSQAFNLYVSLRQALIDLHLDGDSFVRPEVRTIYAQIRALQFESRPPK